MTRTGQWARLELPWGASLDLAVPDTYDFLADHVVGAGKYFPPHFELSLALIPADGVVLDLGAHLGTFALAAAASGRRVIAVEASPRNVDLLRTSARANGLDGSLTVVPVAISNRTGSVRFRQQGAWGQIASSQGGGDVVEVPARTGAEILEELGLTRVDLVKMDVEGSEIAAIDGMTSLLAPPDAPVVVYESNAHTLRMFDATPEDLIAALAALGYDNYLVGEREFSPVTTDSFQPETNVDYIASKRDIDPPPMWTVRRARTENDIARAAVAESREPSVALRAQVARSLERAPGSLLARRDVQLALSALSLDPDETVARAAAWWVRSSARSIPTALSPLGRARASFHSLAEQGRALRDRFELIRIRWGARP
jgi:FkbM family methyltransferase